jgi:hypothetical protein
MDSFWLKRNGQDIGTGSTRKIQATVAKRAARRAAPTIICLGS